MSKKFTDEEIDEAFVKDIYNSAVNYSCNGIYVPTNKHGHPCRWDFISFEMVDKDDPTDNILVHRFDIFEISNGCGSIEYLDETLLEILKMVHGQVAFELNQIDW